LRPESQQLKKYGRNSKAYPAVELKIGGYTDNVGDPTFNLKFLAIEQKSVG
jgi:outer membrane protein OmpA-like peptidoglycan-associated protein